MFAMWLDCFVYRVSFEIYCKTKSGGRQDGLVGKAHTVDPELHSQDPCRVRREPSLQIHPLTSTPTYSYTHNIKEYKKNCFQKS